MTIDDTRPLVAEKFLEAALAYLEPLKGTHIYRSISRDYMEKTGVVESGYGQWLTQLFSYLTTAYQLAGKRVLDFGCGTGELAVRMRTLGYEAYGFDLHEEHLRLARILAAENGLTPDVFILNKPDEATSPKLPFPDQTFDIITLLSVLEHINDAALRTLLPELRRICRGVIYVLVPNRLKVVDDHTGLRFVCWMPRCVALPYVGLRGHAKGYHISADGTWDVYNRTFRKVKSIVQQFGLRIDFPPDEYTYPPLQKPLTHLTKRICLSSRTLTLSVPAPWNRFLNRGSPSQALYPYLNMVWVPKKEGGTES